MNPTASRVLAGYLLALSAGALWGTPGPLSTALDAGGAQITDLGFWRLLPVVGTFFLFGLARPALFRVDRRGLLLVGVGGGALVALFEVAFPVAISGAGVASAVALLYTAPVVVTELARPLLGERVTALRLALAVVVMVGAALTAMGARGAQVAGIAGGLLSALSYAFSTLLARFAVPRYGAVRVLFLEIMGGTLILALLLPLSGHAPLPPAGDPA